MVDNTIWAPVRRVKAYEQVLEQIEGRILNGDLQVGSKLPSEREFTKMLGVSRASVREALRALEAMGIVDSNTGSGEDAGAVITSRFADSAFHLIRMYVALGKISMEDLIETRIQLERNAAWYAASRHTSEDIEMLADIVEKMYEAGSDHERLNALNAEFHIAVARMSGNKLTMDLVGILRSATRVEMEMVVGDSPDWSQSAHMLTIEHGDILRALQHGDEETAAKLIGSHISRFYQDRAC